LMVFDPLIFRRLSMTSPIRDHICNFANTSRFPGIEEQSSHVVLGLNLL